MLTPTYAVVLPSLSVWSLLFFFGISFHFSGPVEQAMFAPEDKQLESNSQLALLTPGDLLITEIMVNPEAVADAVGEYFEVHNTTMLPIDMNGMFIFDDGSDALEIFTTLIVPPGGFVVFGPEGDTSLNGGVFIDWVYDISGFSIADTMDAIFLFDESFVLIDGVVYDYGNDFPGPSGTSIELDPESFHPGANDMGDNWCGSTTTRENGDSGTPGEENTTCTGPNITITTGINVKEHGCCNGDSDSGAQAGTFGG